MILKKLYCKICNLNCKTSIRLKFHSKTVFFFSYLTTKVQRKLIGLNCLHLNILKKEKEKKKKREREREIKLTKLKTKGSN